MPVFSEHVSIRGFLHEQLRIPDLVLVITPTILHEFIHVITDARRFDPPVPMSEALATARIYLGRKNIKCVDATEPAMLRAFDLLDRHGLGRKRLADTLFAATLMQHGVREIITCNPKDFQPFDGLDTINPRAKASAPVKENEEKG